MAGENPVRAAAAARAKHGKEEEDRRRGQLARLREVCAATAEWAPSGKYAFAFPLQTVRALHQSCELCIDDGRVRATDDETGRPSPRLASRRRRSGG